MKLTKHLNCAKKIKEIEKIIHNLYKDGPQPLPMFMLSTTLKEIKSILDDDYHSIITDKQYQKLGHIYYGVK